MSKVERPSVITTRQTVSGGSEIISTDLAALIDRNLAAYRESAHGAFSPETERALRNDSKTFTEWCSSRGLVALPAEPETVAAFIDNQSRQGPDGRPLKAPATVRRYAASISHLHRAADVPNPCERSVVKLALKRMGKANRRPQRQAKGLTRDLVDKMMEASGDTLRDLRNRVALAVGYDTLARRSEAVALLVEDIHYGTTGEGSITVRRSKTDQMSEGSQRYLAPETMELVGEWIGKAGIEDGTLLRVVLKGGKVGGPMLPRDITRIYRDMAAAAGLPLETIDAITSHSTRVGAAQDMAATEGIELPAIMVAGAWTNPTMVARYTKKQDTKRGGSAKLAEARAKARKQKVWTSRLDSQGGRDSQTGAFIIEHPDGRRVTVDLADFGQTQGSAPTLEQMADARRAAESVVVAMNAST